jgi:hypothetical protein
MTVIFSATRVMDERFLVAEITASSSSEKYMERNVCSSTEVAKAFKEKKMDRRKQNKQTAVFRTNKLPPALSSLGRLRICFILIMCIQ